MRGRRPSELGGRPDPPPRHGRRQGATLVGLLLLIAALVVGRLALPASDRVHDFAGAAMGTTYRVRVDADLAAAGRRAVDDTIRAVLDRIEGRMSTWDTTSELMRLNLHRGTDPLPASRDLIEVLALAAVVAERSGGAFDVTVGPLVKAWGFGPAASPAGAPSPERIAELLARVDHRGLHVDAVAGTVAKSQPQIGADLSAIAKGWAAERVGEALDALGLAHWLVEVGGEVQAGAPRRDGRAWRVGIESPTAGASVPHATLDLVEAALATSGPGGDVLELDGRRYAHLLDPRSGRPIPYANASVSILHERAALADAWATALAVHGPEAGYELAVEQNIAALFLATADGRIVARPTPAFLVAARGFAEMGGGGPR